MSKSPKSGFVAIIGEPNFGKSTLLNAMLGKNADLADRDHILPQHVSEAIQYRSLDRQYWNA